MNFSAKTKHRQKKWPLLATLLSATISGQVIAMSNTPKADVEGIEAKGKIVRFIAVGDTGTGKEGQYQVANAIEKVCAAHGCDFALGLGDNIYEYETIGLPFLRDLGKIVYNYELDLH